MIINDRNFDTTQFVAEASSFRKLHGNIYISEDQVYILNKYNINVLNYSDVQALIYDIETYLNSSIESLNDLE